VTDAPRPSATQRAATIAAAVLVAASAGAFIMSQRGRSPADPPGSTPAPSIEALRGGNNPQDTAGVVIVHRLELAVRAGDRAGFLALAEPGNRLSQTQLRYVFVNLHRLEVTDFAARYVGDEVRRTKRGDHQWVASVDMSWRLRGFDTRPVTQRSSVEFATHDGRTYVEHIGLPRDNRWPMWALGPLTVCRHDGAVAVAVGVERARTTLTEAERAIRDVRRVVGSFDMPLLVIAMSTARQFDRLVGVPGDAYANIAAVTTTADGSLSPRSLTGVDLNPTAFGRLGPVGAQVVMSHEATHAATRAVTTSLPAWLEEGFADFVALRDTGLPRQVVAAGLLGHVRKHGAPARLPGPAAFVAGAAHVGHAYEAGWLACQMIAQQYGQDALVRLYEQAGKVGAGPAMHRVLGMGPAVLTRDWQRYLEGLAGG
jgi:hypothetical protein